MTPPLDGVRVLELGRGIPSGYCTKLLCDLGADVVKVEPPDGDPLRRWSATGSVGRDGHDDGALFRYLAAGKRSIRTIAGDLLSTADVVVTDAPVDGTGDAVVVTILDEGPEFVLQARCGSLSTHGRPDRAPLQIGGRMGEWTAGVYAAAGALTALRLPGPQRVDVSMLEAMTLTFLTYTSVFASFVGMRGVRRFLQIPGVEPCKDGYVGIYMVTGQQWLDFLSVIERPDLAEDKELAGMMGRILRGDEVNGIIRDWTMRHTAEEIVERATLFRVPAGLVGNGETLPRMDHLVEREVFVDAPGGGFVQPRPPFRFSASPAAPLRPPPRLGEHDGTVLWSPTSRPARAKGRPLEGVKVLDLTAFWAGPFATLYLASMGAEVIKVESVQRPDMQRFTSATGPTDPKWYEKSALFAAVNAGKKGITINLASPEGVDLALRLAAKADVVIENFTPRVMDQFGLTYERLREVREDLVVVRLPAFGLTGPWRDRPGFAPNMEQVTGMAWITGYPDDHPVMPGGFCDPLSGVHYAVAMLAALEHRHRTGEGQLLEIAMVDVAANVTAEQVIEHSAYGQLLVRDGNRGPAAAPQGVYPCAGEDAWVAIAVGSDDEWRALRLALDDPPWAADPSLATADGRRRAHDEIDAHLTSWTSARGRRDVTDALSAAGVPAWRVVSGDRIADDESMSARGFFQRVDHPVAGSHEYPGWPMTFSSRTDPWFSRHAPVFGEHTTAVLRDELGLDDDELARLREAQVIGDRPLGL